VKKLVGAGELNDSALAFFFLLLHLRPSTKRDFIEGDCVYVRVFFSGVFFVSFSVFVPRACHPSRCCWHFLSHSLVFHPLPTTTTLLSVDLFVCCLRCSLALYGCNLRTVLFDSEVNIFVFFLHYSPFSLLTRFVIFVCACVSTPSGSCQKKKKPRTRCKKNVSGKMGGCFG
jgi:hypothetical protein